MQKRSFKLEGARENFLLQLKVIRDDEGVMRLLCLSTDGLRAVALKSSDAEGFFIGLFYCGRRRPNTTPMATPVQSSAKPLNTVEVPVDAP